ncbi:MAG: alpha/beta hydrolase [Acidimicrobiales bacterium]|jgi:pimeloyl-ACP methyl ester carboxylesterase
MSSAIANGITIEYETFGDPGSAAVLLIMGLGGQLTAWDLPFCNELADAGFYVIRYDNRDVGRSTWFDEAGEPGLAELLAGSVSPAYTMSDMAADAAGLLDALGLDAAHIVGASMGGMIAQTFAIAYPERTRTLVSIMSTTGDRSVGQPHPQALAALAAPVPTSRDAVIAQSVEGGRIIGSTGYPFDEQAVRERAAAAYDRAFHPGGTARQLAAILSQPDRTTDLSAVRAPALVIHGEADPLVDPSGGRATAAAIPGAQLKLIPGMGHDLPPALTSEIVADLAKHFSR